MKHIKSTYQHIHLESVNSTNRYLLDYVQRNDLPQPIVCTTNNQTKGYGQQGKSWLSNQHSAVFSIALPVTKKIAISGIISLKISAIIHQYLSQITNTNLKLKWPNDLYNQHGKVAGILIEIASLAEKNTMIIGVGINRLSHPDINNAAHLAFFELTPFINQILNALTAEDFFSASHKPLINYWQQHDWFQPNETVELLNNQTQFTEQATYLGINSQGQAELKINNNIRKLSSGILSIRKISL